MKLKLLVRCWNVAHYIIYPHNYLSSPRRCLSIAVAEPTTGFPRTKKLQVEHNLECGPNPRAISNLADINQKTIDKWWRRLWMYSSIVGRLKLKQATTNSWCCSRGLVSAINRGQSRRILMEMRTAMYEESLIRVSVRTILKRWAGRRRQKLFSERPGSVQINFVSTVWPNWPNRCHVPVNLLLFPSDIGFRSRTEIFSVFLPTPLRDSVAQTDFVWRWGMVFNYPVTGPGRRDRHGVKHVLSLGCGWEDQA